MASTIFKTLRPLSRTILLKECNIAPQKPLLNKISAANAWVGSYRIKNPQEFLDRFPRPRRWPRNNEVVHPIQEDPTEDRRPATYYHYRENIKYSPKKFWQIVKFMRGMNVDEAIKQLSFLPIKGAQIAAEVLKEAQDKAVREHNFEFKSNMWIEEAICCKGLVIKGLRKHARMRFGTVHYFYVHLCLKLTEGEPPKHFYRPAKDGNDLLKVFYDDLRNRKIPQGM